MAKKAAAEPVSIEQLVLAALVKAAEADGDVKLTGKGEGVVSLFASAAGVNKEAIERAVNGDRPVLRVVRKEGKNEFVRLTRAGFEEVRAALPPERVVALARGIAAGLPGGERFAFLDELIARAPDAAAGLIEDLRAAREAERAEAEAHENAAEARRLRDEANQRARDEASRIYREREQAEVDRHVRALAARGITVGARAADGPEPPPTAPRPLSRPTTAEERDFRRDVAERLVSSWRDAVALKKDEARGFLETALETIGGVRRVGEAGEQVRFDGAVHEAIPGVFTDHPVRITRSGWALEEGEDRECVIEKAQIAK